jgi:hypothetical protein
VEIERTVPGVMTEEQWPEVLEAIRSATRMVGRSSRVGPSFEWLGGTDDPVHVTITPRADETRIRLFSRYGAYGAGLYVGAGTVASITSLALCAVLSSAHGWPPLADAGLVAGLFGGAFASARTGFSAICRSRRRRAESVMRALEKLIARPARPSRQAQASDVEVQELTHQVLGERA